MLSYSYWWLNFTEHVPINFNKKNSVQTFEYIYFYNCKKFFFFFFFLEKVCYNYCEEKIIKIIIFILWIISLYCKMQIIRFDSFIKKYICKFISPFYTSRFCTVTKCYKPQLWCDDAKFACVPDLGDATSPTSYSS